MPTEGTVTFDDLLYGTITVEAKELEDQVLLKTDKMPTYNFANVIDDHLMDVTYVMRGNEYLSSTPKYNLLYDAFGWEKPKYIHLSPIMKDETRKLSKRFGDANFEDFCEKGYLPHAIVNYICLLGWAPKENEEKFTMDQLIEKFSIDGLKKSGSIFDIKKLQWFNGEYLKDLSEQEYINYLMPFMKKIDDTKDESWYRNLALLVRERLLYGQQIVEMYDEFFVLKDELCDEAKELMAQDGVENTINILKENLKNIENWCEEEIFAAIKSTGKMAGVKGKMLFMPCRIAITKDMHGPDLGKTLVLLGKENVLNRLGE